MKKYKKLFNHLADHYDVHATETELSDIVQVVREILKAEKKANLKPEDLEKGKVYFVDYNGRAQNIGRFSKCSDTMFYFSSMMNTFCEKESFESNDFCCIEGFTALRKATKEEKRKLKEYETKNEQPQKDLGELQDYVIELEKRIIKLEPNA